MKVLTDWYPPEIKPVREGLYITRQTDGVGGPLGRVTCCVGNRWTVNGVSFSYPREWRGLAFDPDAACLIDYKWESSLSDIMDIYKVKVPR